MNGRRIYRALLAERAGHIVPGVYDALSAKIAEKVGFRIIGAGGYAAMGALLAGPDIGQSNMRDVADHYRRIAIAVETPVTVDADTGFGDVHNVTQTVRTLEAAGVAGIMIGDQEFPNRCGYMAGKAVIPVEEMLAKIGAAVAARRDHDLVIIARTDSFGVNGLDDAVARCRLFLKAGADIAKPQGVDEPRDIVRVISEVSCPFAATLSQAAGGRLMDVADLKALGVATISMPSISMFAAAKAVSDTLGVLAEQESLAAAEARLISLADYNEIVGLEQSLAAEASFREGARSLIEADQRK